MQWKTLAVYYEKLNYFCLASCKTCCILWEYALAICKPVVLKRFMYAVLMWRQRRSQMHWKYVKSYQAATEVYGSSAFNDCLPRLQISCRSFFGDVYFFLYSQHCSRKHSVFSLCPSSAPRSTQIKLAIQ